MSRYAAALADLNMQAFLVMIRVGEGTPDEDGYRRHFGGRLFTSFADHPRVAITAGLGKNKYTSTAAGAYQFLSRTWDECAAALDLPDFSPASQDLAAVFLIDRRRALADVLAGRFEQAVAKCAREWASLPGSPYGQPVKTMQQALETYRIAGGVLRPTGEPAPIETIHVAAEPAAQPQPQEATMPLGSFIAAALPAIVQAIPTLGKLFGSGSEVAERNVRAAELAVQIVSNATGARNAQEAVEILKTDPTMAHAATEAVQARWHELSEAGGGGIDGARKADAAVMFNDGPWWQVFRSPSFWFMALCMPVVYAVVGSIVGLWGTAWPNDVRAAIATAVVSLIVGGGAGYYWGQTTSRNRTPGA
jgi:muramidase (phage lysozyme)